MNSDDGHSRYNLERLYGNVNKETMRMYRWLEEGIAKYGQKLKELESDKEIRVSVQSKWEGLRQWVEQARLQEKGTARKI